MFRVGNIVSHENGRFYKLLSRVDGTWTIQEVSSLEIPVGAAITIEELNPSFQLAFIREGRWADPRGEARRSPLEAFGYLDLSTPQQSAAPSNKVLVRTSFGSEYRDQVVLALTKAKIKFEPNHLGNGRTEFFVSTKMADKAKLAIKEHYDKLNASNP